MSNLLFWILLLAGVGIVAAVLAASIKVLREWERGVILRLGRLRPVRGPGLTFIIPLADRLYRVDLRVITLDVTQQRVITHDNVSVEVDAVVFYQVRDAAKSVVAVENFQKAAFFITQTTLRDVLGQSELDDLLARREVINQRLQTIIDQATEPWGIKIIAVEVRDVRLPETMQRAMSRQAEAEREKRARVLLAEGEFLAAEQLTNAGMKMSQQPTALQLRYLETLTEIAAEKNSTILFPVPIDLLQGLTDLLKRQAN
ncbi:MAG TPA: slipin family protein [Anaerolineae bacterium]|nr:slipin family protein [Anaerolineae bacterium]